MGTLEMLVCPMERQKLHSEYALIIYTFSAKLWQIVLQFLLHIRISIETNVPLPIFHPIEEEECSLLPYTVWPCPTLLHFFSGRKSSSLLSLVHHATLFLVDHYHWEKSTSLGFLSLSLSLNQTETLVFLQVIFLYNFLVVSTEYENIMSCYLSSRFHLIVCVCTLIMHRAHQITLRTKKYAMSWRWEA